MSTPSNSNPDSDSDGLRHALAGLTAIAGVALDAGRLRIQTLDGAQRDAETWQHRRASHSLIDRAQYRLGGAFAPGGSLTELDDLVITGLDVLGATGMLLLGVLMLRHPQETISAAICRLQRTRAGRAVRENGVWARRVWLSAEYTHVVIEFETSPAGRDPKARWRSQRPVVRQKYLALELARLHEIVAPDFATRGAAHDWLKEQRGRFDILRPPPPPALPSVEDLDL